MKKLLGLLMLAACSSSSGSATLSGSGATFSVHDVFAVADGGAAAMFLTSLSPTPTCGDLTITPGQSTNFTGKVLSILVAAADGSSVTTGTYPIEGDGGSAASLSIVYLSDGGVAPQSLATAGSVTLTEVGSTFTGSFTVTLSDLGVSSDAGAGEQLIGNFTAPTCSP
jgi:hypothetical protein